MQELLQEKTAACKSTKNGEWENPAVMDLGSHVYTVCYLDYWVCTIALIKCNAGRSDICVLAVCKDHVNRRPLNTESSISNSSKACQ